MNSSSSAVFPAPGSHDVWAYEYFWGGFALLLSLVVYAGLKPDSRFGDIPAIGGDGFLFSWFGAVQALKNGHKMIEEGHRKYKQGVFRVPYMQRWQVFISGKERIEEMLRVPEEILSMMEANNELVAAKYTLGASLGPESHHARVVRGPLNRRLDEIYSELCDEIIHGFEDNIPVTNDWIKVKASATVLTIVSRATNRILVGLPKCRDQVYLDINIRFAQDVILGAELINMFPNFLKPLAGRLLNQVPGAIRKASKHMQPIIEERRRGKKAYGPDYPDKPNDMLSWLMDSARGEEGSLWNLTKTVLNLNFAALHTSSTTFTHALYHLAARPQYIKPLREEAEVAIAEEGWSMAAIARMRKLDSFFKESMRVARLGTASIARKAVKPFTFSDGTRIPKGAFVTAVSFGQTYHAESYLGGDPFDGFRFSNLGDDPSAMFVVTSSDLLTFGHGRHACPGRFFAATEIKTIMAYLLLTYDVKMENEGVRPEDEWFLSTRNPDRNAEVLFRRRQA